MAGSGASDVGDEKQIILNTERAAGGAEPDTGDDLFQKSMGERWCPKTGRRPT